MDLSETIPLELLSLRAGELVVELAPLVGGSIAAFYSEAEGARYHWLRPATKQSLQEREPEGMASFPLVPFCNRIRNGRARFEERTIAMGPNRGSSPHTIHGTGWKLPWKVVQQDARSAVLQLDCEAGEWPFAFRATQTFTLSDTALTVRMEVENRGTGNMPLGFGHHPYLPHRAGTRLQLNVDKIWEGDAEVMPTRLAHTPVVDRLRNGTVLREIVADNNFVGWDHRARVDWPAVMPGGRHAALTLEAESPFDYFVLYSPDDKDFFCIEPVSNCTDWLNLGDYARSEIGGSVLAAGESCSASFSLTAQWV